MFQKEMAIVQERAPFVFDWVPGGSSKKKVVVKGFDGT